MDDDELTDEERQAIIESGGILPPDEEDEPEDPPYTGDNRYPGAGDNPPDDTLDPDIYPDGYEPAPLGAGTVLETSGEDTYIVREQIEGNPEGEYIQTERTAEEVREMGLDIPDSISEESSVWTPELAEEAEEAELREATRLDVVDDEGELLEVLTMGDADPDKVGDFLRDADEIQVGIQSDNPETLPLTDDLKAIAVAEPELFAVLVREGIDAFNDAIAEHNREVQKHNEGEAKKVALSDFVASKVEARNQKFIETMTPFKEGDSYNLGEALSSGVRPVQLIAWGFEQEDVERGQDVAKYLNSDGKGRFSILQRLGDIPADADYQGMDEEGRIEYIVYSDKVSQGAVFNTVYDEPVPDYSSGKQTATGKPVTPFIATATAFGQMLWESVTPHDEANETFPEYLKTKFIDDPYFNITHLDADKWMEATKADPERWERYQRKQSSLEATYESEQNQPLWLKVITEPSVYKDPEGNYIQMVMGYAPMVSPTRGAGLQAVKNIRAGNVNVTTISPSQTGLTSSQYSRFLRMRVNNPQANITPEGFKLMESASSMGFKVTDSAGKIRPNQLKTFLTMTNKGMVYKRGQWVKSTKGIDPRQAHEELVENFWKSGKAVPPSKTVLSSVDARRLMPGTLGTAYAQEMLNRVATMNRGRVIEFFRTGDEVGAVVAVNPVGVQTLISKANPTPRQVQEMKTNFLTSVKTEGLTEQQRGQVEEFAEEVFTTTKVKTEAIGQTRQKEAVQEATSTRLKEAVETQAEEQIQGEVQNAYAVDILTETTQKEQAGTQTQFQEGFQTQTSTRTQTSTDTDEGNFRDPVNPIEKTPKKPPHKPDDPDPPKRKRARLPSPPKGASQKEKYDFVKKAKGASGWVQGELNGEPVYHVVTKPYSEANHVVLVGEVPDNVEIHPNARSAYNSFISEGLPPDVPVRLEGGIADPVIFKRNGKTAITFVHDKPRRRRGSGGFPKNSSREIASGIIETGRGKNKKRRAKA